MKYRGFLKVLVSLGFLALIFNPKLVLGAANVYQYGDYNTASIDQTGPLNEANIYQGEESNPSYYGYAKIIQTLDGTNQATIWQVGGSEGASNIASIYQDSETSTATISQTFTEGDSSNEAYITQSGDENSALITQLGSGNYAKQYQEASSNYASIYQEGTSHYAYQEQTGSENEAYISQYGDSNIAEQYQYTNGNYAYIYQEGTFNEAYQYQGYSGSYGGYSSTISQNGNYNYASVTQN
ncbi:MAG: hypothetical protein ACPLSJ_05695 [Thermosulfidibacteraceae bacterium]|jgi:hypothetical protein